MNRPTVVPATLAALAVTAILAGCTVLDPTGTADARALWEDALQRSTGLEDLDRIATHQRVTGPNGSLRVEASVTVDRTHPTVLFQGALHLGEATGDTSDGVRRYTFGVHGERVYPSALRSQDGYRRDVQPGIPANGSLREVTLAGARAAGVPGLDATMETLAHRMQNWSDDVTFQAVEETTWRGEPAHRIAFRLETENVTADGDVVVTDSPRRLAHTRVRVEAPGDRGPYGPMADPITVTSNYTYGDDVEVHLPDAGRAPAPLEGAVNRSAPDAVDAADPRLVATSYLPRPRGGMASATVGDHHYLLGGRNRETHFETILRLGPDLREVQVLDARLPRPVDKAAAAAVGGDVYLFGGETPSEEAVDAILRFDPQAGTVEELDASLPEPRMSLAAVPVDGDVYLFGGQDGKRRPYPTVLRFDPDAGTVHDVNVTLPVAAGWDDDAGLAGGEVYLFGGRSGGGPMRDEIVRFDPDGPSAEVVDARLPNGLRTPAVAWTGETFYVAGGDTDITITQDVYRYDPQADVLVEAQEQLPEMTTSAEAFWLGDRVGLVGGRTAGGFLDGIRHLGAGPWRQAALDGAYRVEHRLGDRYRAEFPLEDLQLEVTRGEDTGPSSPLLTLAPSRGRAEADEASLWYRDRDGDGLVSAGDAYGATFHGVFAACELRLQVRDRWAGAYAHVTGSAFETFEGPCVRS